MSVPGPLSANRVTLVALCRELDSLVEELVFVGGHVAELLITSSGATRVRPTVDVDAVVTSATRAAYHQIEARLSELRFKPDQGEGTPICRWVSPSGIRLDVMPMHAEVLGFTNRWYVRAVAGARRVALTPELIIRVPHPALFLATKWEAVEGRGAGDLLRSHDMEDIIAVVAGRATIVDEVAEAEAEVRAWLAERAAAFLAHAEAEYALQGALPDAVLIPDLITSVRARFEGIRDRT